MGILEFLMTLWQNTAGILESILPRSPFADLTVPQTVLTYLGYANWLFPIEECGTLAATVIGLLIAAKAATAVISKAIKLGEIVHIGGND